MKTTYLIVTLAAILIFTSALKSQEKPNVEANYTKLSELQEHSLAEVAANPDTVIVNINYRHKVVVVERDSQGRTKEIVYYKKNRSSWTSRCNILF